MALGGRSLGLWCKGQDAMITYEEAGDLNAKLRYDGRIQPKAAIQTADVAKVPDLLDDAIRLLGEAAVIVVPWGVFKELWKKTLDDARINFYRDDNGSMNLERMAYGYSLQFRDIDILASFFAGSIWVSKVRDLHQVWGGETNGQNLVTISVAGYGWND